MSFINNLPGFSPNNEKEITLADIAKCKGSGSFAGRIMGQIETLWKTGHFVTDKAVADFMIAHKEHLNVIADEFKILSMGNSQIDAKQLKADQGVARKLSKVFANVSHAENLKDFESEMRTTHSILKGLKALDRNDPVDLLRAVAFERDVGIKPALDLKQQFREFVKGKEIVDEDQLKAAFQEFKNEIRNNAYAGDEDAIAWMASYPKDRSVMTYLLSGHEDIGLYPKEFTKVQAMTLPELLKSEIQKPQAGNSKIIEKGLAAMDRYDPVDLLKAAVYDKQKDEERGREPKVKDDLKSDFVKFVIGKDIKNEEGLKAAYAQFKNETVEAAKSESSVLEKMQKYPKDMSLEKFNSKYEKFKSKLANQMESESSEFEGVDLGESSSLISEVKEMGVEELVVILSWGSR